MSLTNREKQADRIRARRRQCRRRRQDRRGVLLLVVLSVLVLFLLIGTTFVITTSSSRTSARAIEQTNQTSLQPGDRLERALLQVLRDTNNPHSAVRYHSLLRDVYGTDGFVAHVLSGNPRRPGFSITQQFGPNSTADLLDLLSDGFRDPPRFTPGLPFPDFVPRYADADPNNLLGPTNGQLIDLFVVDDLGLSLGDDLRGLTPEFVVDLELDNEGLTTNHRLSRTAGYYNGCLLTILDGPARGQTTRIVGYDYIILNPNADNSSLARRGVARIRVLAFPRSDGSPLELGLNPQTGEVNDLIRVDDTANVIGQISTNDTFSGARFMVNGRPYSGSGVGQNPFAEISDPKLTALELVQTGVDLNSLNDLETNNALGNPAQRATFAPVALLPNAVYHDPLAIFRRQFDNNMVDGDGLRARLDYGVYPGPGGGDESYDAADYQNLFLALQSLTPRADVRVASAASNPTNINAPAADNIINSDPGVRLVLDDIPIPSFHRPALINYWFHQLYRAPWLVSAVGDPNQRVRAILQPYNDNGAPQFGLSPAVAAQIVAIKRKISLRPLREDHPNFDGSNPDSRYANRFDPGPSNSTLSRFVDESGTTGNGQEADDTILFPFWEATGPWDVDNDNDGVPDSIWVDLGDPVQRLGDGRLYKPLYAILVEDLDGRLNLNAQGSAEHLAGVDLDGTNATGSPPADLDGDGIPDNFDNADNRVANFNLPSGASTQLGISLSNLLSSNQLPHGAGWGPADITLRPVLSPDLVTSDNAAQTGDPMADDYARLLRGRRVDPAANLPPSIASAEAYGRYGSVDLSIDPDLGPGINLNEERTGLSASQSFDTRTAFEFFQYPQFDPVAVDRAAQLGSVTPERANTVVTLGGTPPTAFATSPDLGSRYSVGVGYTGQPVFETALDVNAPPLLADTPYEIDLGANGRFDAPQGVTSVGANDLLNDDAPFAPAELERVLRALDPDADRLPGRLWNLVDAFDPDKLVVQLEDDAPIGTGVTINRNFRPTAQQLVRAQLESASRRRSVTTVSSEIPTPNNHWYDRLVYGADGRPGQGGADEDGDLPNPPGNFSQLDEADEFNIFLDENDNPALIDQGDRQNPTGGANGLLDRPEEVARAVAAFGQENDDYLIVMGAMPPQQARLIDYLRYRVTLELKRRGAIPLAVMPDASRDLVRSNPAAFGFGGAMAALDAFNEAETRVNLVIFGDNSATAETTRHARSSPSAPVFASYGGLLAPEVISGQKMDVNRPFGDGRDNNGNGVVDEPQEAGEPFIDLDGNGVRGGSEPFLNLNGNVDNSGNPIYDPPLDTLFAQQLGGVAVPFDYTNGTDANGRGATTASGERVRDDGRMARQLYARHLYCLMLLVMDEGYLAPFDDRDAQVMHYLDPDPMAVITTPVPGGLNRQPSVAAQIAEDLVNRRGLDQATAQAEARRIALRKLTLRRVAQWAINCVDMRDADAIATPFEYDENPWDGWNVVDTTNDYDNDPDTVDLRVYPLDGELTTDENHQYTRDVTAGGWSAAARTNGFGGAALPTADFDVAGFDQTRGVVWGAERPELLLTEGLALHDRRVSDEEIMGTLTEAPTDDPDPNDGEDPTPDDDLDQWFQPQGSAFIEVYNPWSVDGPLPAELYRDPGNQMRVVELDRDEEEDGPPTTVNIGAGDVPAEGVLLDRLSDGVAPVRDFAGSLKTATGRRTTDINQALIGPSPVWRMICVEQHPRLRNDDPFDNPIATGATGGIFGYQGMTLNNGANGFAPQGYREVADENVQTDAVLTNVLTEANPVRELRARILTRRANVPNPPRMADPDFPTFDRDALPTVEDVNPRFVFNKPLEYIEREWYFTRERALPPPGNPIGVADPYAVGLCVPDRPVVVPSSRVDWPDGTRAPTQLWPDGVVNQRIGGVGGGLWIYNRRFPPLERFPQREFDRLPVGLVQDFPGGGTTAFRTIPLAPVLPGQYGVIGSAGTVYEGTSVNGGRLAPAGNRQRHERYITRLGRFDDETSPTLFLNSVRRIELAPNRNPYLHQVVIGKNFGDEFRLMEPVPRGGEMRFVVNATDPSRMPMGPGSLNETIANSRAGDTILSMRDFNDSPDLPAFYTRPGGGGASFEIATNSPEDMRLYSIRPAIAAPIENMNISEPPGGYVLRRGELSDTLQPDWLPAEYGGEGTYGDNNATDGYDQPFDLAPELTVNHTTPNYRSVHLQRLANPLLAWNPPQLRLDGTIHPQHDPNRPVNPYVTVDSMSLDLTAMNSINRDEEDLDPQAEDGGNEEARTKTLADIIQAGRGDPATVHLQPHFRPSAGTAISISDEDDIVMTMATQSRGFNAVSLEFGEPPGGGGGPTPVVPTLRPGRLIWQQERPNQMIDILNNRFGSEIALLEAQTGEHKTEPTSTIDPTPIDIAGLSLPPGTNNTNRLTTNYLLQHSLGYDNNAVIRRFFLNPSYLDPDNPNPSEPLLRPRPVAGRDPQEQLDRPFYRGEVQLVGSFPSTFNRNAFNPADSAYTYRVDLNGDGVLGDLVGVPLVNEANTFLDDDPRTARDETTLPAPSDYRDDTTNPWMTWNDRPFIGATELLQTPAASSSELTRVFSVVNPFLLNPPSRYDGFAQPLASAAATNTARRGAAAHPYGHLLNAFQGTTTPAVSVQVGSEVIPIGAPHFHRVLDYLATPSRFVGTDVMLNPDVFNAAGSDRAAAAVNDNVTLGDARRGFQAPFNRVARNREPGKLNLNTMVGRRDPAEPLDLWSPAYDGLMHRLEDGNFIDYGDPDNPDNDLANDVLNLAGHLGPAWRDVVLSRRGYTQAGYVNGSRLPDDRVEPLDYSPGLLHPDFPTRFANPFRSASAGDLVPLPELLQVDVDASILRAHPISPGLDGAWGRADQDDLLVDKGGAGALDRDLMVDNTAEAGANIAMPPDAGSQPFFARDVVLSRDNDALPDSQREVAGSLPVEPLFGEATTEPALDGGRNPGIAYNPMTRLANLTTTRSGAFAVWITVGFFEVTPAPDWDNQDVRNRFGANGTGIGSEVSARARDLYDRVYPDGYQLGREIGSDTGDTRRFKAFYLIDRTLPVAFRPGEDLNVEDAVLLRRRIE